jgi:uncharacterized sulfatase
MALRLLLLFALLGLATAWLVSRLLAPVSHGVVPGVYANAGRTGGAAERLISRTPNPPARPPNLVVILADDLGWGDLGVQGSRAIASPNLDTLAAEGLRLSEFYASAPVCSPSRAGLLTGRYPLRSGFTMALPMARDTLVRRLTRRASVAFAKLGVVDMVGGDGPVLGLPSSEVTVAEALKVAGYRTMAIGKWHLGDFSERPEYHPHEHGFDRFVGFPASNDDFPVAFYREREMVEEDIGADQSSYTRIFTDAAVAFIEAAGDEPFFLYLAHKDPHLPFFPSEAFAGRSLAGPYGDAVEEFDWSVGQVVETIRRKGIERDTLVVVTSDNGPWYEGDSGGLRGRKGQSYEGGFRVPFVAWWPGRVPGGAVDDTPAMNIDLFPTFLALAAVALPDDRTVDGVDLAPVLLEDRSELPERPLFFSKDYDVEAVRVGRWKYIERNSHYVWPFPIDKPDTSVGWVTTSRDYHPADGGDPIPTMGTWPHLYDLERDPAEAYNVQDRHPEVAARLAHTLDEWRADLFENPRGWQ